MISRFPLHLALRSRDPQQAKFQSMEAFPSVTVSRAVDPSPWVLISQHFSDFLSEQLWRTPAMFYICRRWSGMNHAASGNHVSPPWMLLWLMLWERYLSEIQVLVLKSCGVFLDFARPLNYSKDGNWAACNGIQDNFVLAVFWQDIISAPHEHAPCANWCL